MKKKNRTSPQVDSRQRNLSLRRETIAHLSTLQLGAVAGGVQITSWQDTSCNNTSAEC